MDTPRSQKSKTSKTAPSLDVKTLFSAMAYDLKVERSEEYLKAYSLLCAGKYLSFLSTLDEWTSQLYESIGSERYRLHQLAALLSKYPFEDPEIDRDKVALSKFSKAERKCARMNKKFRLRRKTVEPSHMQYMRDFIISVIGYKPNLQAIFECCDFGPGSNVGVHGSDVSVLNKLDKLTVTPAAKPVAEAALTHNKHYMDYLFSDTVMCSDGAIGYTPKTPQVQMVQYNKIVCVPKNAKTHRTIAIEPSLNGFIQKGVDLTLRRSLFRIGVDLSRQDINQHLAYLGSRDNSYATIDLSSASDSISIELVKELLPPDWFAFLNCIRSPSYMLPDGSIKRYEKFCSMGNGFCFPLETLIFRAACGYAMSRTYLTNDTQCHVYGDDIIVPKESALLVIDVLRDLGFRTNAEKTFIWGPFRESCGADYFNGKNVRPIYVKRVLKKNHDTYPLLNSLRRMNYNETWQRVFDQLPASKRLVRPYPREDDTAITVDLDTFMASKFARWNRGIQAWTWKRVVSRPRAGRKPATAEEVMIGKLRGDLSLSDTFSARFSERTRMQLGC